MSRYTAPRPLNVTVSKPRNPFVAASLMRRAGSHQIGKARQQAQAQLRQELEQLGPPDRSP